MTTLKSLLTATVLTSAAALSFAQGSTTPATPAAPAAAASAPAAKDAHASKAEHKKTHKAAGTQHAKKMHSADKAADSSSKTTTQ